MYPEILDVSFPHSDPGDPGNPAVTPAGAAASAGGEKTEVCLQLRLPTDYPWFQGHFPARGVMPAVAQLDLVMAALRDYLHSPLRFAGIRQVKFVKPLQPGQEISLSLKLQPEKLQLQFTFAIVRASGVLQTASEGRINLCS